MIDENILSKYDNIDTILFRPLDLVILSVSNEGEQVSMDINELNRLVYIGAFRYHSKNNLFDVYVNTKYIFVTSDELSKIKLTDVAYEINFFSGSADNRSLYVTVGAVIGTNYYRGVDIKDLPYDTQQYDGRVALRLEFDNELRVFDYIYKYTAPAIDKIRLITW